jgi:hypothetical protein
MYRRYNPLTAQQISDAIKSNDDYSFNVTFFVAASDSSDREKNVADYVCDGTADNVEIQAAIDALPVINNSVRGTVMLSSGQFVIADSINMFRTTGSTSSNIQLRGINCATTQIYLADGTDKDCIVVNVSNGSDVQASFTGVYDLEVNGNRANNAQGTGTEIDGTYGNGILITHSNRGAGTGAIFDFHINRVMAINCSGHGMAANTAWGGKITDSITELNDASGLYLGGGQCYISNHFSAYNRENGMDLVIQDSVFSGIHMLSNGKDGIFIQYPARNNNFDNIYIEQYGREDQGSPVTTTANSRGIFMDFRVRDINFNNVTIIGQGTANSLYAIRTAGIRCNFTNITTQSNFQAPIFFDPIAVDNYVGSSVLRQGTNADENITNSPTGMGTVTIAVAGTGYVVGDEIGVAGGSFGTLQVTSIGGSGDVTGVKFADMDTADYPTTGVAYDTSSNPRATTGGTGTGCTINITALGTNVIDAESMRYVDYE